MFDCIYDKIGMAGVVLAVLPFFILYFFQLLIYLAWILHGFRNFCAEVKPEDAAIFQYVPASEL
jgi:hypothetical protein